MAELLNAIIARGGTTAHTSPVTRGTIAGWMARHGDAAAWHMAEDDTGGMLGFQFIEPHPGLPPEACDIATFVRLGQAGLGIGSRLFEASASAARARGYAWINATIRADNAGGLAYYQSRGFEDYAQRRDTLLADGTRIDKISKRYNL